MNDPKYNEQLTMAYYYETTILGFLNGISGKIIFFDKTFFWQISYTSSLVWGKVLWGEVTNISGVEHAGTPSPPSESNMKK